MRRQYIYRDYFDIDPEYFPAVNAAVITRKPDMWQKFYPHESFVKLLKDVVKILDRKQKLSLWVEGKYGTGKSHAILTVKKLLDASADDAKDYFVSNKLDIDLYNSFQRIKDDGRILTVHRYGSSGINGDNDLILAVQESVESALADAGVKNQGGESLKEAMIRYLSNPVNKESFDVYVKKGYSDLFGGDDVDAIIEKLQKYQGEALHALMNKIFKVSRERQIRAFSLTPKDLAKWLTAVIRANGLKAIVFFWDEFAEYLNNNARNLTGFQELLELSETEPFYFIIVTHNSEAIFKEKDPEFKKLNDRFVKPHAMITLPENIAFQLMEHAMKKNSDPVFLKEWKNIVGDLAARTEASRSIVQRGAKIKVEETLGILPIHPFAALMLKNIATAFNSNQRSMFDFIKNDQGDEIKGFQWFIDNFGPEDENPLLTIDMLWEFFYDKGRDLLEPEIRSVLDYFTRSSNKNLTDDQKRVLKAILLMSAISLGNADVLELFIPNGENLDSAFEGSDLENGQSSRIAEILVKEKVLFKKPIGRVSDNKFQYAAYASEVSGEELDKFKEEIDKKSTSALIKEVLTDKTTVASAVKLTESLNLRYNLVYASASDFDVELRKLRNWCESEVGNKIPAVVCFAKNDDESASLMRKIREAIAKGVYHKTYHFVFIDASRTPMGIDAYERYRDEQAQASYHQGKDNKLSPQYGNNAREVLKKWRDRISVGDFVVFSEKNPTGERVANLEALSEELMAIDKSLYPDCIECAVRALPTMYQATQLKLGVECGATRKTRQVYSSGNANTKLDAALGEAWTDPEYWKNRPNLWISRVKRAVDEMIRTTCEKDSRISIRAIYDALKAQPYGFMPCNLTAFILGFLLREYVEEFAQSSYSWSDGLANAALNLEKLKEMVDEVIKLQNTPNPRYKDKYIVAMTEEEKAFNETTAFAFDIDPGLCTSVEQTRERVRDRMKKLDFPIWTLKSILASASLRTDRAVVAQTIDAYCGLVNSANVGRAKTDVDFALEIGKTSLQYPSLKEDLQTLFTKESCVSGMQEYVKGFEGGKLVELAREIGDLGKYIDALRKKFDADAANWVWNVDTAEQKIREVILEYEIIAESNKILQKNTTNFDDAIGEWLTKCNLIRIAYQAAKNELGAVEPLLLLLEKIKRAGTILDSQKEEFRKELVAHGEEFNLFYNGQETLFRKLGAYYFEGLSDEDVSEIFRMIPSGVFTDDKTDYLSLVEGTTIEYRNRLGLERLKKLWREKTGSESPRQWSRERRIPILCLVPNQEWNEASEAFDALNRPRPDAASVEKAIAYLERANFYEIMQDPDLSNMNFRFNVLREYNLMLEDLDEVKTYLEKSIDAEPYDWCNHPEVKSKLEEMAQAKYVGGGYEKAFKTIDEMPAEDVKRYLKDLIKNNMVVGMEIMKGD